MSLFIYPYKMGSRSAHALSRALKVPQIRHKGSKFIGGRNKTIINWGAASLPEQIKRSKVINGLAAVSVAGNKLAFFKRVEKGARVVPWTTSQEEAAKWLKEKAIVVARTSLTGHSGHGIVIVDPSTKDALPQAPLYTKYVPKDSEWRIHIVKGQVVDVQRKVRDPDKEPKDWKVRSHDNGFIFIRETAPPHNDVTEQALSAFKVSGLDFGAFDVIFNKKRNEAYVLEANTAPGLEGHTVEVYANALRKIS